MLIRTELPSDEDAIHELTATAFAPMPYSNGSEAPIIRALRSSGDLTFSLVAEEDGVVIGHVAFSPVTIDGVHGGWFGLGPISVQPERQHQGIGKALISDGLKRLKERGAAGCALIGNPEVYRGSGFESDRLLSYGDLDRRYVQRIVFSGPSPRGVLKFADAFEAGADQPGS
ncbi:N-acetyltransferase [Rhizobium sp. YS-1r]|uniref:GNAT family N-acetyltransferase n=1 Tax=Rhizobium sp. YS-1r TaxID=1532558 RepID=UPI00050F06F1|nr:N-acetyltransferase [Rhizobium sp. YS-1r]KGE01202.1 GCN5 family acetyltransferase [Rhizobium sp. YS-1r]